jgi:hypothetical protein
MATAVAFYTIPHADTDKKVDPFLRGMAQLGARKLPFFQFIRRRERPEQTPHLVQLISKRKRVPDLPMQLFRSEIEQQSFK